MVHTWSLECFEIETIAFWYVSERLRNSMTSEIMYRKSVSAWFAITERECVCVRMRVSESGQTSVKIESSV